MNECMNTCTAHPALLTLDRIKICSALHLGTSTIDDDDDERVEMIMDLEVSGHGLICLCNFLVIFLFLPIISYFSHFRTQLTLLVKLLSEEHLWKSKYLWRVEGSCCHRLYLSVFS